MAALKTALRIKEQRKQRGILSDGVPITVVTILCDHGSRHLSKFWNDEAMTKLGIQVDDDISAMMPEETN